MSEAGHPDPRRVSTSGRALAAVVLCERTTLERLTIVAIVDGAALLLDADDATSARLLLGLAVDDATATDVLTALATPARRPGAGTGPDAGTQ